MTKRDGILSWMEVEAKPSVYVQWGTACEYSNYDSTNRTVTDVAHRASKHIVVDPRVTPLGKSRHLAAASSRHRRRAGAVVAQLDHRKRSLR